MRDPGARRRGGSELQSGAEGGGRGAGGQVDEGVDASWGEGEGAGRGVVVRHHGGVRVPSVWEPYHEAPPWSASVDAGFEGVVGQADAG